MIINKFYPRFSIVILIFAFLLLLPQGEAFSKKIKKVKKKSSPPVLTVENEKNLAKGVVYRKVILRNGRYTHTAHVIECDLTDKNLIPEILLPSDHAGETGKLQQIIQNNDSIFSQTTIAAINGSFWKAYSQFPIGPTIKNGELIELRTHKRWSSIFFDRAGKPYIDNFFIFGNISTRKKINLSVKNVNRRFDSLGIVLYNKFGGDTIPFINYRTIDKLASEILADSVFSDSTDEDFDFNNFKNELTQSQRMSNMEFSMRKAVLTYLDTPGVNSTIRCRVIALDTGAMEVPKNGCILSFGYDVPYDFIPETGDTLRLKFSTNLYQNVEFYNSASGTPRLVRNGLAAHEAYAEGSKSRRFIKRMLPRTAIGYDKNKTRLFLVCVDPNGRTRYNQGANLSQLSLLMSKIGAYNAMNLDGGGSTTMVIERGNVMRKDPQSSRRIAVGIGIVKKNMD